MILWKDWACLLLLWYLYDLSPSGPLLDPSSATWCIKFACVQTKHCGVWALAFDSRDSLGRTNCAYTQKILSELLNMYKAGIVTRLAGQAYSLEATAVAAGVRLPSERNYNYLLSQVYT